MKIVETIYKVTFDLLRKASWVQLSIVNLSIGEKFMMSELGLNLRAQYESKADVTVNPIIGRDLL